MEDLERRLRDLEGKIKGFRFENLGQNEQFVSATVQATQAAIRTHEKEKLNALRSAVLNVAAGTGPDVDKQTIFLQLVDKFSTLHLRLLRFSEDPKGFGAKWVNHRWEARRFMRSSILSSAISPARFSLLARLLAISGELG